MLEEDSNNQLEVRNDLKCKLMKLRTEIRELENMGEFVCTAKCSRSKLITQPSDCTSGNLYKQKYHSTHLRELIELSCKASTVQLETFSRKLRVEPGELYVYDCSMEGATPAIKFHAKFCETVLGPGDKCGTVSEMEASIFMRKGDPESLSEWVSVCTMAGDMPLFINGLVEFSHLAHMRRYTLQSIYKRGKIGLLGSSYFRINGMKDNGVLVVGVGPEEDDCFSVTWKIGYCDATKSMMPKFDVEFHTQSFHLQSMEVFSALQKPYLKEEDLPQLWEAVADTLT